MARPPRAPITQLRPFALSTDARAPRRAAAVAAQHAAHEQHSAASRVSTLLLLLLLLLMLLPYLKAAAAAAAFSMLHLLRHPSVVYLVTSCSSMSAGQQMAWQHACHCISHITTVGSLPHSQK